jgi:MYXO-CTERM domain-containing protein
VTYTPRKQLERDTSYTVAINTDARDSSQTALAADAEYSFRTRQYGGGLTGESCGSSRGQSSPWVLLPLLVLLGWALRRRRRRAAATC